MNTNTRLIDLSHVVFDGLITYKGLPGPVICDYLSREASKSMYDGNTEFQIGRIDMVTNTGTYIDCPFHRYESGKDLSEVSLEAFVNLEAVTINAQNVLEIGIDLFRNKELRGRAVLIHTGWSAHWNTPAYF